MTSFTHILVHINYIWYDYLNISFNSWRIITFAFHKFCRIKFLSQYMHLRAQGEGYAHSLFFTLEFIWYEYVYPEKIWIP